MSQLAQVAEIAGVSAADVVRVATRGGDSSADWEIAFAIQEITGRRAVELMFTAGHREAVAQIWADSREEEPTPVPAPESRVETEDGAEERRHPGAAQWRDLLHTRIWPAVARVTRAAAAAVDQIVSRWDTARAAVEGFTDLLARQVERRSQTPDLNLTREQVRKLFADYATAA